MKYLLWLLGTSLFALILTLVLAAIGVSGVQSLTAAMVFLWIAFAIYAGILLDLGIRETSKHHGSKAALITLLLVCLLAGGWWARSWLAGWLSNQKTAQTTAQKIPPLSAPKPPTEALATPKPQIAPSPKGALGGPHVNIRQGGKGNTANPGTNTAPVNVGNCGVFQNGGSNNTASPNCGRRLLTSRTAYCFQLRLRILYQRPDSSRLKS